MAAPIEEKPKVSNERQLNFFDFVNGTLAKFGKEFVINPDVAQTPLDSAIVSDALKSLEGKSPKEVLTIVASLSKTFGLNNEYYQVLKQKISLLNDKDAESYVYTPDEPKAGGPQSFREKFSKALKIITGRQPYIPPIPFGLKDKLKAELAASDMSIARQALAYMDFRELSAKEQWRTVAIGGYRIGKKATEKTAQAAKELGAIGNIIFSESSDFIWNDRFYGKWAKERGSMLRAKIDKQIVAPAREKIVEPAKDKIRGLDERRKTAIAHFDERAQRWAKINQTLASEGVVREAPETAGSPTFRFQLLKGWKKGRRKRRARGVLGWATNILMKVVLQPIASAIKVGNFATKVTQGVAKPALNWTKARLSAITERAKAISEGAKNFVRAVQKGWSRTTNTAGAVADGLLPAVVILSVTGNLPVAIVAGSVVAGASLTDRLLSSPNMLLRNETLLKYGTFESRGLAKINMLDQGIAREAAEAGVEEGALSLEKLVSKDMLKKMQAVSAAELGGSSVISSIAKSVRAAGIYSSIALLAYSFGLNPVAALLIGGGGTLTHYGVLRTINLMQKAQWERLAQATKILSNLPLSQMLGLYMGVEWFKEQMRKMRELKGNYFKEEWMNLRIDGGLGNMLTLGFSISSAISFTKWIGSQMAIEGVGGAAGTTLRSFSIPMLAGGLLGTIAGVVAATALGLPIGTAAVIGGIAGTVIGAGIGFTIGGGVGVLPGSAIGSFLGTMAGSGIDWLIGRARQLIGELGAFINFISVIRFVNLLASFLTSPLRRLSDMLELVFAFVMVATTIGVMAAFSLNSSSSNTPAQEAGTASTNSQSVFAAAFPGITFDTSLPESKELIDLRLKYETTEIKSCFRDDMEAEGYFALEKGYYNPIKKNYGMILSGEKYMQIKSPIEGTIIYSGKNNLYTKSRDGDFIKSEENSLIIAQILSPTYFIAFDGLDTELKTGDKIKSGQVLGESTQDFRISVLNSAEENMPYNPRNATDPCTPLDEAGFPGFACDIIPSFTQTCK